MNSGPTISIGSTGHDVRRLQRIFVMTKVLAPSNITGTFDSTTEQAVKDFQQGAGLTVDGIVGPITWQPLPADPNFGAVKSPRVVRGGFCSLSRSSFFGSSILTLRRGSAEVSRAPAHAAEHLPSPASASAPPASLPAATSNFYLAMRVLPQQQRDAMYAVYAFCRAVDDVADDRVGGRDERRAELDRWREDIAALYAGRAALQRWPQEPIVILDAGALAPA